MAQFISEYPVDILHAPARAELPALFKGDDGANRICARVTRGGREETLSGTVAAVIKRADGTRTTQAGSTAGNLAYVTLSSAAYSVPGALQVFLSITSGSTKTTLLECNGTVRGI